MNVCHVLTSLEMGGMERVVCDLVQGSQLRGITPSVFCTDAEGSLFSSLSGVACTCGSRRASWGTVDWSVVRSLVRFCRREHVNVLHAHNHVGHLYAGIAGVLTRLPVLVTLHGQGVQDGFKTRILRRILCFRTAQVVAVSEDARSVAVRSHAVPINKLCIVHNGIDTRRNFEVEMRSHRDAMREKLGISAGTTVIGTVGRLSPEKDYTMLIEAFAQWIAEAHPRKGVLVLVGDGIERSQLEREAERLGVQTLCRFAGEQRNVPAWLSIFNVFCLSSRTEGLSISLLEAGACGLPCVVTDVGGNREVVRDGHNGFLVPYRAVDQMAAAFRRLHTDPEMRVRMGGNARENVDAHFSLKKTIDDYEQLYMSV
jgi:glycosyltransferase involved in cell wall biosynthesis